MVKRRIRPYFSILMPTHNRADVIPYAIESVLHQTVQDFELLIIGDGCTDTTEKIVRSYMKKDARVRWFSFPKGPGFGYAHRNVVLKKAPGKYIAFAAHDDLWFPDHLEIFKEFFTKHPKNAIAYTRPLWVHPDGTVVPSSFNTNNGPAHFMFMKVHNEIPADCVVHVRETRGLLHEWNAKLPAAADWDAWKNVLLKAKQDRMFFIPTPTTLHFRAHWRKTKNAWNEHLKSAYHRLLKTGRKKNRLTLPTRFGFPQQSVVWKAMQQSRWAEDFRSKVIDALDQQAEDALYLEEKLRATTRKA